MRKFKFILFLAFIVISSQLKAQNYAASKITDAKVYRQNAELTQKVTFQVKQGTSELVIGNISTLIIPTSLQVAVAGNNAVTLLSAKYENNYLKSPDKSQATQKLTDSLEYLKNELRWLNDQKNIFQGMEDILNKNKTLAGEESSFKPADLTLLINNYQTNLTSIRKNLMDLDKKEKALAEKRNRIQNQLQQIAQKENAPAGQIVLQIDAKQNTTANFKITYLIHQAGWTPIYDLRSEGVNEKVKLAYKAQVFQRSGLDWDKVNLTVSTGNPSQNNNQPRLNTQWIDVIDQTVAGKTYYSKPLVNRDAMALEEVQVTSQLRKANYNDAYAYNAQVVENTMNVDFVIKNPQSILADGKQNLIGLDTYELTSNYMYQTTPKLDKGAFLLANVSDWSNYNLLPGNANVFFEGAFVGTSYINTNSTNDSLSISMGRDEGVVVKRETVKDFTSKKLIGSNSTQVFTYEIEIRNTKKNKIQVEVLDQIPVSKNDKIEVKLENSGGGTLDAQSGKLTWKLDLNPNETKKITFSYSVKSPKDVKVMGL